MPRRATVPALTGSQARRGETLLDTVPRQLVAQAALRVGRSMHVRVRLPVAVCVPE